MIHMIRNQQRTFCGKDAEAVYTACPEPGCEEHAKSVTCPECAARPTTWDYLIRHALTAKF